MSKIITFINKCSVNAEVGFLSVTSNRLPLQFVQYFCLYLLDELAIKFTVIVLLLGRFMFYI